MKIERPLFICLLVHILLPLALGMLFYLLFMPTNMPLWRFCADIIGADFLQSLRPNWQPPNWFLHHFSDGLWGYALTASLILFTKKLFDPTFVFLLSLVLCAAYEFGQKVGYIGGTFDWIDILVMWAFCVFAFLNLKKKI